MLLALLSFLDLSRGAEASAGSSPNSVPRELSSRLTNQSRGDAMQKYGGTDRTERAVMKGLRWLKEHQNADGSWSTEYRSALTGFAVLCFLAHGELPESSEFGPAVKRGIDWLHSKGTEHDGKLSMTREGWGPGNAAVYEHAIATYALAEYYAMTHDARVADLVQQAANHIVQGQAQDGGWQYGYNKGPNSDTSVSGWQIQALRAVYLTGLAFPKVEAALDKAMFNLKRVQDQSGNFGYLRVGDHGAIPSLAGVGVYCTYVWKQDKDRTVREGIEYILRSTDKYPVKYKQESADLYGWYYNTLACVTFGGDAWNKWNRLFRDEVCNSQSNDGSWPPLITKAPGGEFQRKLDGGGPIYRTALCTLMLESYYRYSPR